MTRSDTVVYNQPMEWLVVSRQDVLLPFEWAGSASPVAAKDAAAGFRSISPKIDEK
jgi:hypothetical protein